MQATLYEQSISIEKADEQLRDLKGFDQIDVAELQGILFQRYERNPVLYDSIKGRLSVEESLDELAEINKGVRKIIPWRKNKAHNERFEQLGELVSAPHHLKTRGIFMPDNFFTAGVEVAVVAFGITYLLSTITLTPNPDASPEEIKKMFFDYRVVLPATFSSVMSPFLGFVLNLVRLDKVGKDEVRYVDTKVRELYR